MNSDRHDSSDCPSSETLHQIAEGNLRPDQEEAVVGHLDHCEACRQKLEAVEQSPAVIIDLCRAHSQISTERWERIRQRCIPALPTWQSSGDYVELVAGLRLGVPRDSRFVASLGRFDVVGILGHGGMGFVLEGFDRDLQRQVALKVMKPELAGNQPAAERFLREARAAARLEHPNVVTVHDVDTDSKPPFIVMEYVRGRSLSSLIGRESRLRPVRAARITIEILAALARAHEEGLIHRDVKPGNVMLDARIETAKLADFGLARGVDDALRVTREDSVLGTPWYMAPEQAAGERRLDGRCDLFSTGVVLFEMLTGGLPFPGRDRRKVARSIVDQPVPDPRQLNPDVPHAMVDVLSAALKKDPEKRYPTALVFIDALQSYLAEHQAATEESTELWVERETEETRTMLDSLLAMTQDKPPFRGRIWIRHGGISQTRDILTVTRDNRDCCRIGEKFELQSEVDVDAYLTLLDVGTSGKVHLLLLNHPLQAGKIAALAGPDEKREWVVGGPPGVERIKALFTRIPLALGAVQPFSPLAPEGRSRDIVTRIKAIGARLDRMPDDHWSDATCQFIVD